MLKVWENRFYANGNQEDQDDRTYTDRINLKSKTLARHTHKNDIM